MCQLTEKYFGQNEIKLSFFPFAFLTVTDFRDLDSAENTLGCITTSLS